MYFLSTTATEFHLLRCKERENISTAFVGYSAEINHLDKVFYEELWNAEREMGSHVTATAFWWFTLKFSILNIARAI